MWSLILQRGLSFFFGGLSVAVPVVDIKFSPVIDRGFLRPLSFTRSSLFRTWIDSVRRYVSVVQSLSSFIARGFIALCCVVGLLFTCSSLFRT